MENPLRTQPSVVVASQTFDVEPRTPSPSKMMEPEPEPEPEPPMSNEADEPDDERRGGKRNARSRNGRKKKHDGHRPALHAPAADSVNSGAIAKDPHDPSYTRNARPWWKRVAHRVCDMQTCHHKKSREHFSIRDPTRKELERAGVTQEQYEQVIHSEQLQHLIATFGETHLPSTNMLLHIAANQLGAQDVKPEMFRLADEDASRDVEQDQGQDADAHCRGEDSVGQMLYNWTYTDVDVPWKLMKAELNASARRQIERSRLMIDPDSIFRQSWDLAQVVLLIYLVFSLPYQIGFSIPDPPLWSFGFWLGVAADLYFVGDILLNFVTCIKDEEGMLITEFRVVFAKYLEGWFLVDVISVVPLHYIVYFVDTAGTQVSQAATLTASVTSQLIGTEEAAASASSSLWVNGSMGAGGSDNATGGLTGLDLRSIGVVANAERIDFQLLKALKALKLVKILRFARLRRLKKIYEVEFFEAFQKIQRYALFIGIGLVSHWLACIWNFIGTYQDENGQQQGWVIDYIAGRYPPENGTTASLEDAPLDQLYLVNYFAAVSTLIAGATPTDLTQGSTLRATSVETFVSLFAVVAGSFLYGQIVSSITELNRKKNMASEVNDMLEARARALCQNGKIDESLRERVLELVHDSIDHAPDNEFVQPFLSSLTGNLETEFAQQLGWVPKIAHGMPAYGMLHKVPFFTSLDNRSKILICSRMRVVNFEAYDPRSRDADEDRHFITTEGRACSDMFIVMEGKVAAIERHKPIGFLEEHLFFGEACLLQPQRVSSTGQLARRTHYAVGGPAKLAVLGYEDFQELRKIRPEINDAVLPYIKELESRAVSHRQDWFFIEIRSARGITAKNRTTLAAAGQSDSYCCLHSVYSTVEGAIGNSQSQRQLAALTGVHKDKHKHKDKHDQELLIGTSAIAENTVDPNWNRTIMLTREEVREQGGDLKLRFEVYHHNPIGTPDFLGQVETSLADICAGVVEHGEFSEWGADAEDVKRDFKLMSKHKSRLGRKPQETKGTLQIVLTNRDPRGVHVHFTTPAVQRDVERRRIAQHRRHLHVTDELADLAEVKSELKDMKERQVSYHCHARHCLSLTDSG